MSEEMFELLLAPHLQAMRRFIQTRLRTGDFADDVLQQALLRAFTGRHQLRDPSKFKSWLWSIALNEVRMFLRGCRPVLPLDEFPNVQFPDGAPSPLAMCEETESHERLRAAMARLTRRDRTAIQLVDFHGLSIPEAARTLAVSKSALKSAHYRARRRLGHALRGMQAAPAVRIAAA